MQCIDNIKKLNKKVNAIILKLREVRVNPKERGFHRTLE